MALSVYVLPVSPQFQPSPLRTKYPKHNKQDYGIEQDFLGYLKQSSIVTDRPDVAVWHYLPVYWTRYHVNHAYGKTGQESLQQEVVGRVLDEAKTFTICQYDDGPLVDVGEITLFLGSRKGERGINVPLLSYPHEIPSTLPPKRWLASFTGRIRTHSIRSDMRRALRLREDVSIRDTHGSSSFFAGQILQSYIALCPRGYGGSSFRFYEAMQLGVVPLLIGDMDTRPFRAFLDWDQMSFYTESAKGASEILDSHTKAELLHFGECAKAAYDNELAFGKWCKYVFKELETLK